jgi:hypothetical protein
MVHILCMCPRTWQAQYKLKADTVPQGVHDLLDDLEKIKKAFPTEQEQPGKKGKVNPSDSGKCKMVSIHKPIPKMPRMTAKHCALFKMGACMCLTIHQTVASMTKTVSLR